MHIGVITPAYNVAPYIGDAIRSLLRQSHRDWSLIVVNDGSTDGLEQVLAGFADARIRLINQAHAGVSAARNTGLAAVGHAGAVLFLDGDDWLAPTALTDLAKALADSPWAVAACARYARVHTNGTVKLSGALPNGPVLERLLVRNLFANGGHLLIASDAIRLAGGFRTDLTYGEDWEYWCRLALLGEFAAVRSARPALYVRERPGSASFGKATDHAAYTKVLDVMHTCPETVARIGAQHLPRLRGKASAEAAWAVGRELIRRGRGSDGTRWLLTSLRRAPSLKRVCLLPLSWLGLGPFQRHGVGLYRPAAGSVNGKAMARVRRMPRVAAGPHNIRTDQYSQLVPRRSDTATTSGETTLKKSPASAG